MASFAHSRGVRDPSSIRKLPPPAALTAEKPAPHSIAAEQALLGAVMVNNRQLDDAETLRPEYFYVPLHAAVFEAIEHLINERGVEANPIAIRERLRNTSFDADNDLFPHLKTIFEHAGFTADVKSLTEVIHTAYVQRQLIALSDTLRREAERASTPELTSALVAEAGDELYRLDTTGTASTLRNARESLREMIVQAERAKSLGGGVIGVASGFTDLDNLLGGLQRSDLIILGARPSMGKTSLLLNIAQRVAANKSRGEQFGAPVGMFSLEMSAEQLMQRMAASAAAINSQQIANGRLSDADFGRLAKAAASLGNLPFVIDDAAGLTIQQLRARARQMKRQHGIGLLIVDYLQLLTAPGRRNDQNRVQEVTDISQGLKQVARELDIPVLVASQLSRNLESRDNKRPLLADLRESGSIEQDADVCMFLYREEYYLSRQLGGASEEKAGGDQERRRIIELKEQIKRNKGVTELIVAKNRKGPTDCINLLFHPETTTFTAANV